MPTHRFWIAVSSLLTNQLLIRIRFQQQCYDCCVETMGCEMITNTFSHHTDTIASFFNVPWKCSAPQFLVFEEVPFQIAPFLTIMVHFQNKSRFLLLKFSRHVQIIGHVTRNIELAIERIPIPNVCHAWLVIYCWNSTFLFFDHIWCSNFAFNCQYPFTISLIYFYPSQFHIIRFTRSPSRYEG